MAMNLLKKRSTADNIPMDYDEQATVGNAYIQACNRSLPKHPHHLFQAIHVTNLLHASMRRKRPNSQNSLPPSAPCLHLSVSRSIFHCLYPVPRTSHLTLQTSDLRPLTSQLKTSHLRPQTSHLTPHTSDIAPHPSHLT